jgi:hypothetical protein
MKHYILCRREHGWGTGPGNGIQHPDEVQVMAASRTREGLRWPQRKLGGWIEEVNGPYRRYSRNETIR